MQLIINQNANHGIRLETTLDETKIKAMISRLQWKAQGDERFGKGGTRPLNPPNDNLSQANIDIADDIYKLCTKPQAKLLDIVHDKFDVVETLGVQIETDLSHHKADISSDILEVKQKLDALVFELNVRDLEQKDQRSSSKQVDQAEVNANRGASREP